MHLFFTRKEQRRTKKWKKSRSVLENHRIYTSTSLGTPPQVSIQVQSCPTIQEGQPDTLFLHFFLSSRKTFSKQNFGKLKPRQKDFTGPWDSLLGLEIILLCRDNRSEPHSLHLFNPPATVITTSHQPHRHPLPPRGTYQLGERHPNPKTRFSAHAATAPRPGRQGRLCGHSARRPSTSCSGKHG